jgi:hypothetical protein
MEEMDKLRDKLSNLPLNRIYNLIWASYHSNDANIDYTVMHPKRAEQMKNRLKKDRLKSEYMLMKYIYEMGKISRRWKRKHYDVRREYIKIKDKMEGALT